MLPQRPTPTLFPYTTLFRSDAEGVKQVAATVRRPVIAALARCRSDDIERAGEALKGAARSRIHTFIATSDLHLDRKSTRLNSSHPSISYAVFCLKKKRIAAD